jgi:ABC-type branched-subunit amino acid transport system substrate-binding protein
MFNRREILTAVTATGVTALLPVRSFAETGVTADKIVFGQAAALDGPAGALGTGMRDGILAAFAEANAAGGVQGRKLELVSIDDGYEPKKAIEATRTLLDKGVFGLVGYVGTPTSMAVFPLVKSAKIPFIGAFTGTGGLRNPYKPLAVNVRASYGQETEVMVERLVKDRGAKRFAILYQDDAYGTAGLAGTRAALDKRKMKLVAEAGYERNTIAVRVPLLEVRKAKPDAVIMIGAYKPCAEFIKVARSINFDPAFINISFVGSDALAKELGPAGAGVLVTQVIPFPQDTSIPVVAAFHKALKASKPDVVPGFVSLEGYVVGRTVVEGLRRVKGELTRETLMAQLTNGTFDYGGFSLTYGPNNNQGSNAVYLTVIGPDGKFKPATHIA